MKDLVIIGGAAPERLSLDMSAYSRIIAADSGYDTAKRLGIIPDTVVGDFDSTSFSSELAVAGYMPCTRDKDDTDAAIAIREARSDYDLVGGGEGRIDHTLSLFVAFRTIRPPRLWLMRSDSLVSFSGSVSFRAPFGTDISLIPLSVSTVRTEGLKWDMDGWKLSDSFISQSNRVERPLVRIEASGVVFLRFFPDDFHHVEFL